MLEVKKHMRKSARKTSPLLFGNLKKFLEEQGWEVELEKSLEDCRLDIFATREHQTLIVEVKHSDGYSLAYNTNEKKIYTKDRRGLYEAIGQAIWYQQYADEVWLVLPPTMCRAFATSNLKLPNIKILQSIDWL